MSDANLDQCLKNNNFHEAIACCDELLAKEPDKTQLKAIKGWCLHKTQQSELAKPYIEEAFKQEPSSAQVVTIAMSFFMDLSAYEKIIEICQRCIAFHAGDRLMWHRLGTAHYFLGEYESSVLAFSRSLAVEYTPSSAFGMSLPLLAQGRYSKGFELYEERFVPHPKLDWLQSKKLPMPRWKGELLQGKSILIWCEQGLGDSIQFGRLLTQLAEQGAQVDVMLSPSHQGLSEIIATINGVKQVLVVTGNTVTLPQRYDFHAPMMSLMGLLKIRPDNIVANTPYIQLPKNYQSQLPSYSHINALKIGIVWTTLMTDSLLKSNPMHYAEKVRKSIPVEYMQPLLSLTNCQFFSLHLQLPEQDKAALSEHAIIDMSPVMKTFTDTAAIIQQMDLIISIDTSVVHLAGAMGKPTLNLLPYASDWRWQNHRQDTPWYPTMRLYQQTFTGDWSSLIKQLVPVVKRIASKFKSAKQVVVD